MGLNKFGKFLQAMKIITYKEYGSVFIVKYNKWNPLSWIYFLLMIPTICIASLILKESITDMLTSFIDMFFGKDED